MKLNLKLTPAKVTAYILALLLFGTISAIALIISSVFILAGFALLLAALSGSGVILLGMKFFGLIPEQHPVLHVKRSWHYAIEIPARITQATLAVMLRVPVLNSVMHEIYGELADDKINARFDQYFRSEKFEHDPFLHGDLGRCANALYNRNSHKELWVNLPAHLRVSLFKHSRLPNGKTIAEGMAPNVIDTKLVNSALRRAVLVGALWLAIGLAWWHPNLWLSLSAKGAPVQATMELTQDFWSQADREAAITSRNALYHRVEVLRNTGAKAIMAPIGFGLDAACSFLFALFVTTAAFRGFVRISVNSRIQPFTQTFPDSIALYSNTRSVRDRVEAQDALDAQIEKLKYDQTPIVQIGTATGRLESLGVYNAPREGAPMSLSFEDLMSGLAVMGGISSGKSRTILEPLVRGIFEVRKLNKALACVYSTDDKGVLWRAFKAIADEMGMGDDVIVVGCKPGQIAIDPFGGASPSLLTDALIAALMQRNGGKSDFFSDAAALHILPCLVLLQAYMHTPDADWWVDRFGSLPYSIDGLERISTEVEPFTLTNRVVDAICTAIETGVHPVSFIQFATPELHDHINTVRVKFRSPGGERVRDSLVRTIATIVSGFSSSPVLRRAFGTGLNHGATTTIDKIWGTAAKNYTDSKIVLVDLSSSEYGSAGNLINQLLKIRLYNETAQRQVRGDHKKAPWLFMVFDEFQSICSSSGSKSTYDDGNWPGQVRSAKGSFIVASQQINSIRQVLGTESTAALLNNLRSRIVLPVECSETLKTLVTDLVGTIQRIKVSDANMFESYHAMRLQTGFDIFRMVADKPRLVEVPIDIIRSSWDGIRYIHDAVLPTNFISTQPLYPVDLRFVTAPSTGIMAGAHSAAGWDRNTPTLESYMSALGAAHHRAEDLTREVMKSVTEEDAIRPSEMTNLVANNRALVYLQNANGRRVDLCQIG